MSPVAVVCMLGNWFFDLTIEANSAFLIATCFLRVSLLHFAELLAAPRVSVGIPLTDFSCLAVQNWRHMWIFTRSIGGSHIAIGNTQFNSRYLEHTHRHDAHVTYMVWSNWLVQIWINSLKTECMVMDCIILLKWFVLVRILWCSQTVCFVSNVGCVEHVFDCCFLM